MKQMTVSLLIRLYIWLLRMYPPRFLTEFGEEMMAIFIQAVREAGEQGWLSLTGVVLREICDWPGSILREHLQARRRQMPTNGSIEEKPLARSELLAAMIIFLLPLFSILTLTGISLSQWMNYVVLVLFWGALIFALGLAIFKRLPPWSLPYLGFALMLSVILSRYDRISSSRIYPYFIQSFGPRSYWSLPVHISYGGINAFIVLFSVLLSALVLVNLLRLLPYTRGVWQRIRADWTQLSFMLYGGLVFAIILAFEEYRYEDIWKFVAWLCLALGAWLYLRAKGQKQRILTLIGGATGALWIVALAKWVLIPLQKWPMGYPVSPSETTRWTETGNIMIGWVFILLMLIAPALLNLLPSSPPPTVQEDISPV
jgi:hypothetical protein